MTNDDIMTLNLRRINVCDVRLALTGLIISMKEELREEATTECRKEILVGSISKWERLKAEIIKQFDEQDTE